MFDIGIQELIIIFVVALIVFGPERLPEIGRKLGKFVIQVRKGVNDAKMQMENEFRQADPKMDEDVSTLLKNAGSGESNEVKTDSEPQAEKEETA